jgi:hypothetical protein
MAIVGDAYVYVRAITDGVEDDIRRAFSNANKAVSQAGKEAGDAYQKSFNNSGGGRGTFFSKKFEAEANRARESLFRLVVASNLLGPAVTGVVGAIGALATSLFSLGSAVGAAAPALIALPATFFAVAQAAITLKLAFSGVGAAISAGLKPSGGGGGAAKDLKDFAEEIERAGDRIAAARRRLTEAVRDNVQRRIEALEAVKNAEEIVQERLFAVSRAQRDYADAQNNTKKSLDDLSKARKQAIEDLQQLKFASEGAVLSEERARLTFERSRDSLQRVQDLPPNSRARQQAELAFKEADLNLRRAIDRNGDLREEEENASAAGVEGSERVLDAQENLKNARRQEQDALQGIIQANKDLVRARLDVAKVSRAVSLIEQENLQRQKDAVKDLVDAIQQYRKARDKQFEEDKSRGGGGSDPFADAMAKLSKEAQSFVRYIISIQDEFKKLKAAAGKELFPQLETAIQILVDRLFPRLIPLLKSTGGVLGAVAGKISETIASAQNLDRLDRIWRDGNKLLTSFGEAAANLYEIFLILLDAAAPVINRFGKWTKTLTEGWLATLRISAGTGSLTSMFIRSGDAAAQLGRIFSNTFDGLSVLFKASIGPGSGGQFLLDWIERATESFKNIGGDPEAKGGIAYFFKQSSIAAAATLGLLGDLLGIVGKLGADPNTTLFIEKLREAIPAIENIIMNFNSAGPVLGDLVVKTVAIMEAFSDQQALQSFFSALNTMADALVKVFQSDVFKAIFAIVGPLFAVAAAIRLVTKLFIFFGKALAGIAINTITLALKALGLSFDVVAFKATVATGAVGKLRAAMMAFSLSNPYMVAFTALAAAVVFFYMRINEANERTKTFKETLDSVTGAVTAATRELVAMNLAEALPDEGDLRNLVEATGFSMTEITKLVSEGGQAYEDLQASLLATKTSLGDQIHVLSLVGAGSQEHQKQIHAEINALGDKRRVIRAAQLSLMDSNNATRDAVDQSKAAAEATKLLMESQGDLALSVKELTDLYNINIDTLTEQEQAYYSNELAQERLTGQTKALESAFGFLDDAMNAVRANDKLKKWYKDLDKTIEINGTSVKNNKDLIMTGLTDIAAKVQTVGGSPEEQAVAWGIGIQKFRTKLVDAGLNDEDLDKFLGKFKATPEEAAGVFDEVVNAGQDAVDNMKELGRDSGDGFVAGLRERYNQAKMAGRYLGKGAELGVAEVLGIESPSKEMAKLGRWTAEGFANGITDRGQKVVDSFTKIIDKLTENGSKKLLQLGDRIKGIIDIFVGDLQMIGDTAKNFKETLTEALEPPKINIKDITDPVRYVALALAEASAKAEKFNQDLAGGVGGDKKRSRLIADLENISVTLQEDLVTALQAAEAQLQELQDGAASFATSIKSALMGGVDIESASNRAKEEGKTLQQVLDEQLNKTRTFAAKVNELIDAGYSQDTVSSVIARGVEGGTQLAQALLDAGTSVLETDKSMQGELDKLAADLAAKGYTAFFSTGIENAKGILDGVRTDIAAAMGPGSTVMTTMNTFAKALGRDVNIKIKLNRKKFDVVIDVKRFIRDVNFSGSEVEAAGATGGIVNRPTIALIGEAGPEAIVPLNKTPGNGPLPPGFGGGVTVNVYPSPGMNETEIADMVSRKLAFEMRRGGV